MLLLNTLPGHPKTAPVARAGLLPRVRRSSTKETKPPLVITGNRECHQECAITNNRLARQVSTFAAGVSIPPSLALNGPVIQLVAGIKKNVKKPSMGFEQFISSEWNHKYANCFQEDHYILVLRKKRCVPTGFLFS